MAAESAYDRIIRKVFEEHYSPGSDRVSFEREELARAAEELGLARPKNLGDIVYSYRYRRDLPTAIRECAPEGKTWIIRSSGTSQYHFAAVIEPRIVPSESLAETKVPDATPGLISMYALGDEQALLAKLRYNRLLDIFTGVACYSLQNHLRTSVPDMGQVETDELYVGVSQAGAHYVFPVQAKGRRDQISVVQVEQDIGLCRSKFPDLICYPIAAQFMGDDLIALFALEDTSDGIRVGLEKHYRLVPSDELSREELEAYRRREPESRLGL